MQGRALEQLVGVEVKVSLHLFYLSKIEKKQLEVFPWRVHKLSHKRNLKDLFAYSFLSSFLSLTVAMGGKGRKIMESTGNNVEKILLYLNHHFLKSVLIGGRKHDFFFALFPQIPNTVLHNNTASALQMTLFYDLHK